MKKFLIIFIAFIMGNSPALAFGGDIQTAENNGVYLIKIPLKKYQNKIKPYAADELTTVSELYSTGDFKLVVNGGFFDPINNLPVSNVIINSKKVQSLFGNLDLVSSLDKNDRVEKVLNRTEFRVLKNRNDEISFDITNHLTPPDDDTQILHSLQAGPMLLPFLKAEEESFIVYKDKKAVSLAADVLKRRERTILGLKKNPILGEYLYIIIFTSQNKVALNEARDYCAALGLEKAMALDGGASTSFSYGGLEVHSSEGAARRVKSFLVIENQENKK